MSYFLEPCTRRKNKAKRKLYLSNFGTKSDLRNTKSINTSDVIKKANLASLKGSIDELLIVKKYSL